MELSPTGKGGKDSLPPTPHPQKKPTLAWGAPALELVGPDPDLADGSELLGTATAKPCLLGTCPVKTLALGTCLLSAICCLLFSATEYECAVLCANNKRLHEEGFNR